MHPRSIVLAVAVLGSAVIAATVSAKNQETKGIGRIRLIHNYATDVVPQPAAVDVRLGKNPDPGANPAKVTGAEYGDITKYLRLKSPVTAGVYLAGTQVPIFSADLGTIRKRRLTLLAQQESSASGAFVVNVLDDTTRKPKRKKANVRVIHGIPAAAANDVRIGAVGGGCLTPAVSYPATAVLEVDAGTYTLGVFPPSDPTCAGDPIPGLRAEVELNSRSAYTAIARVQPGDPNAFQLEVVRDF